MKLKGIVCRIEIVNLKVRKSLFINLSTNLNFFSVFFCSVCQHAYLIRKYLWMFDKNILLRSLTILPITSRHCSQIGMCEMLCPQATAIYSFSPSYMSEWKSDKSLLSAELCKEIPPGKMLNRPWVCIIEVRIII